MTTEVDAGGKSLGGGRIGDKILRSGSVSKFDAYGLGSRHPEVDPNGSSHASGLPYLGGALLPEDFAKGMESRIEHALIFVLPQLRYFPTPLYLNAPNWVYPASRTESANSSSDPYALAAGQRIALNDGVLHGHNGLQIGTQEVLNDQTNPPIVRIFLDALFKYGAFLVDAGGGFGLVAEDIHTANPDLTPEQVQALTRSDSLDETKTLWQIMIETINYALCCTLLDGSGLAFAWMDDVHGFRPNFTVVEEIEPPF